MALNSREFRFAFRTLPFLHSLDGAAGRFELRSRPQRRVLAWQPDLIGDLFRIDRLVRHGGSDTVGPLVGRGSLLFLDGDRHAEIRRILGPALRGGRLKGYRPVIGATAERSLRELPAGVPFPLSGWTHRLTLRLISQIVLGSAPEATLAEFSAWMDIALGSRARTLVYRYLRPPAAFPSSWRTFLRRREVLAADLVRRATATAPGTSNLRDLLVELHGPGHEDELGDQLITMLFAGHETTGSAIAWTLYWLDRHPAVRRDVEAELAATASDGADAAEVPLLAAVCLESLRISPPATIAGHRILAADAELGGAGYPAGTAMTPCIYLAHRQPDIFADPGRFEPRRFLEHHPSAQHYLPFGGGVRRCLGADLALLELRMVVAAALRQRPLRSVDAAAAVPQLRGPAMAPSQALSFVAPA